MKTHDITSFLLLPERRFVVELEALALPAGRETVVGRPEQRRLETRPQLLDSMTMTIQ